MHNGHSDAGYDISQEVVDLVGPHPLKDRNLHQYKLKPVFARSGRPGERGREKRKGVGKEPRV